MEAGKWDLMKILIYSLICIFSVTMLELQALAPVAESPVLPVSMAMVKYFSSFNDMPIQTFLKTLQEYLRDQDPSIEIYPQKFNGSHFLIKFNKYKDEGDKEKD